jgi:hypothetical protein
MVGIVSLLDQRESVLAEATLQSEEVSEDPGLVLE